MKIARWLWLVPPAVLLWYLRTWWHTPVMFLYSRPEFIQGLVISALLSLFVLRRWRCLTAVRKMKSTTTHGGVTKTATYHFRWLPFVIGAVTILFIIVFMLAGSWGRAAYLARTLDYRQLASLPESSGSIRLMPYEVAMRSAKDSLQLSQYRLGTENMVVTGDHLSWVFPLTPDGFVISFLKQNRGIVQVDASTQDKNSSMVSRDMAVGEGMQVTDNLWWNILRHRYFVRTEDPYYIAHDGDIHTIVPAVSYEFRWSWITVHTVPRFAGVFVVNTAGDVSFLTPDEAQRNPVTAGNRFFPELLAREYVNAYQYRLGVINRLFIHEDQIQIQDVRSSVQINRQPFLLLTGDGPVWFVGTEPYGESHGIFKIFIVDAVTGELFVHELPEADTLTGPVRAADYVHRANPVIDWSRFSLVEPLPIILNGTLYWKLAVIPSDGAGIAYQAFVDSRTNQVFEARSEAAITAFLAGQALPGSWGEGTTDGGGQDELIREIREKLRELERLLDQLETRE